MAISIRGINVKFGNRHVLKNVSLDVRRGETVAVMGLSGVGKSTLIRSVVGLVKPYSGQILLEGRDMVRLSESELNEVRVKIGMVFQFGALFDSMTIGDNVAFPLREHQRYSEEEIQRIVTQNLAVVDLEGMEHLYPSQLSGGHAEAGQHRSRRGHGGPASSSTTSPPRGFDPIISNVINDLIRSPAAAVERDVRGHHP